MAKKKSSAKTAASGSVKTTAKMSEKSTGGKAAVAIVYRSHTDAAVKAAQDLAKWLTMEGFQAFTAPSQKAIAGAPVMASSKEFKNVRLVVVLGGDGTYLRAVRLIEGQQIPLLGFNMGSLGFLTVHPASRVKELVKRTLDGKMELRVRTMLHASVRRGQKTRHEFDALNDIVLERGSYSHLINAAIYLGNQLISEVKADGFIVSSPTGSTAYNLAAGGPILEPSVRAFTITPVAPHALTTRPLVVSDETEVVFRLVAGREQKAHFIVDGQKQLEISNEDEVVIRKAEYDHLVVREPDFNYFSLLKEKLKFGDRA
jgi:NAD+ kinase